MKTEARIGQLVLDRYQPQSVIGSGGSGILYRARDVRSGKDVALKLLRADATTAISLPLRWQREASATRALQHPNVVRVLDAGEHLGQPFVVMELLQGRTLQDHLGLNGPLDAGETLDLILPLIGALAVTHDHGLVHRDLKPANVLLAEQGRMLVPKLLDFGIAKHFDDGAITQSGQLLGTPGFMSPEQARGGEIGIASDLWALGALLYVCLSGRLPFVPSAVQLARAPLLDAAPLAHAPLLLPVIERALEWEPSARFAHARALAHALLRASQFAGYALPDDPDPHGLPDWRAWRSEQSDRGAATLTLSDAQELKRSEFGHAAFGQVAFGHATFGHDTRLPPSYPPRPAALPEIGTTLVGRFKLLRVLGTGAMGSVFHAVDEAPGGGAVALKVLHRVDPTAVYRLKQEFRALADVTHPNLIALHELFADDQGRWFFTMELLEARHFDHFVRSGSDGLDGVAQRVRALLPQFARALRHLHGLGRMHRDLKPSNVLVTAQGRLVVVDFGLTAVRIGSDGAAQLERGFQGTPAYAAPEQIEASGALPASDWYALGVMMYEALAGRLPFQGTRDAILLAKVQTAAPHPSQLGVHGPADLIELCMQLLERDPVRRASGRDVLALGALSQAEPASEGAQAPFVGRVAEGAQLMAAFERVRLGQKAMVLVGGPSGIGKTTLVESFVSELVRSQRARLIAGRCYAYEALPYKAFDGVVDSLTAQLRVLPRDVLEAILPRDIAVLAQLFPVLRRLDEIAALPAPTLADERGLRQRGFLALKELLAGLATQHPLIVFVDDLQWGDLDSARLLRELVSEPHAPALLFIGTYRDQDDASSPLLAEVFDAAGPFRQAQRIALGPLSQTAIESLAKQLLGQRQSEVSLKDIARNAQGHPMLASELTRFALEHGSAALPEGVSLEKALGSRLRELPTESRAALELVCVAGRRLPRELLFRAAPSADLAALRQLRLAHATRETWIDEALHIEPYHDQVRELVMSELSDAQRRATHANLAERALELGDAHLDLTVDSYVGAGRLREAAALAERAALRAHAAFAFHRAADLLALALAQATDALESQRLCIAFADACVRAGRSLPAAEHYERASERATGQPRFDLRRQAMMQYFVSGHSARGSRLLAALGDEVSLPLARRTRPSEIYMYGRLAMAFAGWPKLRAPAADHDLRAERDRVRLRLIWSAAPPLIHVESRMAARYVMQALRLAARIGDATVYAQASSLYWSGVTAAYGRRVSFIEQNCARARALVEAHGDRWEKALVYASDGGRGLMVSDIKAALDGCFEPATSQDARNALGLSVQTFARSVVLPALFWSGRIVELSQLADRWIAEARDSGDRHLEVTFRFIAAHRYLRHNDPGAAFAELARAQDPDLDYIHPSSYDPWWHGGVLMYSGRVEEALAYCARQEREFRARSRVFAQHRLAWAVFVGTAHAERAARGIERQASLRALARYAREAQFSMCNSAHFVHAHLAGTLAWLLGKREEAFVKLTYALEEYDRLGMRLSAAGLRLRLAALGHPAATEYDRAARALFAAEGIEEPERWAAMSAPGLHPNAARHA